MKPTKAAKKTNAPLPRATHCKVCKRPLPNREGQRGRPGVYCPPDEGEKESACWRVATRMNEVLKLVEALVGTLTGSPLEVLKTLQGLKGYLWSETNGIANRGNLKGTSQASAPYVKRRSGWWRNAPETLDIPAGMAIPIGQHAKRRNREPLRAPCPVCGRMMALILSPGVGKPSFRKHKVGRGEEMCTQTMP